MGKKPDWRSLRQRLAGKWQIPALVGSIALLAIAFRTLRPSPVELDLKQAADYLATLVSGGMYDRALQDGTALLGREQDTEADRAPIYLQVARARYGEAERRGVRTASVGHRIAQDYQHAVENGVALRPQDLVQLGHVQEWQSRFGEAVALYERAVKEGASDPFVLRRRVIELLRDHDLINAEALSKRIASFLADVPAHRLDFQLWAIEEELYALEAQGRLAEGATWLARYANAFRGSDLENRFSFLEALQLYKSGYYDEAEIRARTIMNRAHRQDDAYAMAGWLLGRVVMYDDGPKRPEEALAFFDDVTGIAPNTPYGVASFVGKAEALALLERPDDALDAYRVALQLVPALRDKRVVNYAVLRSSLGAASERARQGGDIRTALAYSRMAASIIDRSDVELSTLILEQLAANQTRLAEDLTARSLDTKDVDHARATAFMSEGRALYAAAADTYTQIAQLNGLNERKAAGASWRAAESAMRAGESRRAAQMFEMYTRERPSDSLVPRALLRIGQLRKRAGDLDAAIKAFQECYRRYPRTLDGARALVPLAECYLAKAPPDAELAQKTLSIIVDESEVFTPDAPEFSDALFLMGEAQSLGGDPERAIATFEEVIARYPNDARVRRGRYLLADAYRQSALALKAMASGSRSIAETAQLRSSYVARFTAARTQFRALIDELTARDVETLDPLERLYLRHSVLYEADCYFETQEYAHALKLYEEAAGMYRDHPSGLAAYVQIINCHVFLGQPREARAALSRALVVVDSIPEEAFAQSISPETRADWKRYFEWLGASDLF